MGFCLEVTLKKSKIFNWLIWNKGICLKIKSVKYNITICNLYFNAKRETVFDLNAIFKFKIQNENFYDLIEFNKIE